MLEGMRDSTENRLRRLADGKMRLFRTSVTWDDVEVTDKSRFASSAVRVIIL